MTQQHDTYSKAVGYLLRIFDFIGLHCSYRGKPITGTTRSFTFSLFFIGWIIDLFLIPSMDRKADQRFQGDNLGYNVVRILLTFPGALGVYRTYMGKQVTETIYLFTGGPFFLGVLYDFWALNGRMSKHNGPQCI